MGWGPEVTLRGTAKLVFSFASTTVLSHFQSRESQRCHKQAGCYISPGHHVADSELHILVHFSSEFLAIIVL